MIHIINELEKSVEPRKRETGQKVYNAYGLNFRRHKKMSKYAYIRVSSKDQNVARQVEAMNEAGIEEGNMFIDKESGKNFNRLAYKRLLRK